MNLMDNKLNKILDTALDYILGAAAVTSIAVALLYSLFALLPDKWFYILPTIIYTCIFFLAFHFIFKSKKTVFIGIGVFVVAFLIFIVYSLSVSGFLAGLTTFLSKTFSWLQSYVFRISDYEKKYADIVVIGLTFIVSLFLYIFNIKKNSFLPYFLTGATIFIMQSSIMKIHISMPMFYLFMILTLIYWYRSIRFKVIKQEKGKNNGIYTLYIIPCCIFLAITFLYNPSQSKPIIKKETTTRFFETIEIAFKTIEDMISNKSRYFSVKNSGFSDGQNFLGGYLKSDDSIALRVKSTSSVYLKGRMYETYTGSSWETDTEFENIENEKIIIEKKFELENPPKTKKRKENEFSLIYKLNTPFEYTHMDFIQDISNRNTIEIMYEKMYTSSIFLPQYSTKVTFDNIESQIMRSSSMNFASDINNKRGFIYKVEFQKYNYSNPELIEYLRNFGSGNFDTNIFDLAIDDSSSVLLDNFSFWEMDDEKREIYLQLPDTITQETKDLAKKLTMGIDNRYDKVRALELYLKENYSYSKRIPNTPKGQDFVDYFLFDLTSGYCTYYATALSVMCRTLGIPTRYVEGYVVPKASKDGYRYVTNNYAHAWTEVYFEGIGFIPFEATPIYNEAFYAVETQYKPGNNGGATPLVPEIVPEDDFEPIFPEDDKKITALDIIIIFSVVILIIFLILTAMVLINNYRTKRFFKKASLKENRQEIQLLYRFYIEKLVFLDAKYRGHETPYEYAVRIENIINIDNITKIFVESLYGNKTASVESIMIMKDFYKILLIEMKKTMGKFKFFGLHYILGKI